MAEHRTSLKKLFEISEKIRQSVEKTEVAQEKVTETVNKGIKVRKKELSLLDKARSDILEQGRLTGIALNKNRSLIKASLSLKTKQLAMDKARNRFIISEQKRYIASGVKINDNLAKQNAIQNSLRVKTALKNTTIQKHQVRQKANLTHILSLEKSRNTELTKTLARTQNVNNAGKQTVKHIKNAKKQSMLLRQVFAGLSAYSLFIRLKNNIGQAIGEITTLQVKISEIRTISQETQLTQEKWLRSVQELSIKYAHSTADITSGIYQTISNQIAKGEESVRFMENALAFANVTGATSADAVGLLTTGLNAYSKSIAETEQVAASYYKTIELGRVRAEEMASTIGRTAPLASVLGVELNELNAAVATMTIQGQPVNVATTLLRGILLKLIKPTDSMGKLFKKWGVESGEAAVKTMGFVTVIRKLNDEVLKGGQARIGELFGRERPMTGMATLAKNNLRDYENTLAKYKDADTDYFKAKKIAVESDGFYMRQTWRELGVFYQREFAEPIVKGTASFLRVYREFDKDFKGTLQIIKHVSFGMAVWYIYSRKIKIETARQLALENGIVVAKKRSLRTTGLMLGKVVLFTAALEGVLYLVRRHIEQADKLEQRYKSILGTTRVQKSKEDELNRVQVKRLKLIKETYKLKSNEIIKTYNLEISKIESVAEAIKSMYDSTTLSAEDSLKRYFKLLDTGISKLKKNISNLKSGLDNVAKSASRIAAKARDRKFDIIAGAKTAKKVRRIKPIKTGTPPLRTAGDKRRARRESERSKAEPTVTLEFKQKAMLDMVNKQMRSVNKLYNKAIVTGLKEHLTAAQTALGIARKMVSKLKAAGVSKTRINQMQSSLDKAQLAAEVAYARAAQKKVKANEAKLKQLQDDKLNVQAWVKERKLLDGRIKKAGKDDTDLVARQKALDAKVKEKKDKLAKDRSELKSLKDQLDFLSGEEDAGRVPTGTTMLKRIEYKKQKDKIGVSEKQHRAAEKAAKEPYVSKDRQRLTDLDKKIGESMSHLYGPTAASTLDWQSKNGEIQSIMKSWTSSIYNMGKLEEKIKTNDDKRDTAQNKRTDAQRKAGEKKESDETTAKEKFRIEKEMRQTKKEYVKQVAKFREQAALTAVGRTTAVGPVARRQARIESLQIPIGARSVEDKESFKVIRGIAKGLREDIGTPDTFLERDVLIKIFGTVANLVKTSMTVDPKGADITFGKLEDLRLRHQTLERGLKKLEKKQSAEVPPTEKDKTKAAEARRKAVADATAKAVAGEREEKRNAKRAADERRERIMLEKADEANEKRKTMESPIGEKRKTMESPIGEKRKTMESPIGEKRKTMESPIDKLLYNRFTYQNGGIDSMMDKKYSSKLPTIGKDAKPVKIEITFNNNGQDIFTAKVLDAMKRNNRLVGAA